MGRGDGERGMTRDRQGTLNSKAPTNCVYCLLGIYRLFREVITTSLLRTIVGQIDHFCYFFMQSVSHTLTKSEGFKRFQPFSILTIVHKELVQVFKTYSCCSKVMW